MACNGNCVSCSGSNTLKCITTPIDLQEYLPSWGKPTNAVLNLTDECTHRCKMCFVNFNPTRMNLDTAIAAVEFIKNNCSGDKTPSIIFFGGEPLLEFDSLIVPLLDKYGSSVKWSITTNGLLLDEDKVDFFRKNRVNILFSFDGDRWTQNTQRPLKSGVGSFEVNVKNIPYYVLRYPYSEMRATITKESIPHLFENYLFAKKMKFHGVDFIMDSRTEIEYNDEDIKTLEHQVNKIVADIITQLTLGHEEVIEFNNLVSTFCLAETHELQPNFNNSIMRCGLGTTSIGVGTNGDIYPCQEQSSGNNDIIGNIFTGIDPSKHFEHIKRYCTEMEKLSNSLEANGRNLMIVNQICPNRLLHGGLG